MKSENNADLWECLRCGKCCKLFLFEGVRVSSEEWAALEEDIKQSNLPQNIIESSKNGYFIPSVTLPDSKLRSCVFLMNDNLCTIHEKKPKTCIEYPVLRIENDDELFLHVSTDCPRGTDIAQQLQDNPPNWVTQLANGRRIKVQADSFLELTAKRFFG